MLNIDFIFDKIKNMRKLLLTILFIFFLGGLYAPVQKAFYIEQGDVINPYVSMLLAFEYVESNFDCDTINRLGYGGILQIGQQMVDEVNRINGITGNKARFTLSDRLDSTKSVQMWYIVMDYHNASYDLKKATKIWNPKASTKYYDKIKKQIND